MPRDARRRDPTAHSPHARPPASSAERETFAGEREPVLGFDAGSLSWVLPEIDQALERAIASLAAFRASSKDAAALNDARGHVHQAVGALKMVGLDPVLEFSDEIERQLVGLDLSRPQEIEAAAAVVERACRKLTLFLRELTNGAPPVALKLYPEYAAMQKLRGVEEVAASDLFHPDLSPRAPATAPQETIAAKELPSYLAGKRRLYQTGLMGWLRGDRRGATVMREAIAGIEKVTTQDGLRSFWWTVRALLEALTERGPESGQGVRQLVGRIDLQIRRVAEGSAKAADRLRRDVLYYVAISEPTGPTVHAVQTAFGLSTLLPSAEPIGATVLSLQPLLCEAREQLTSIKQTWLNVAAGYAENPAALQRMLSVLHITAVEIDCGALTKLTAALVAHAERMPAGAIADALAMEFTTALLLAESVLANDATLATNFTRQVDAMLERLDCAAAGRDPGHDSATVLDELGQRARERVLFAQVAREIQVNLRRMEQVLDAFFRDHGRRSELGSVARESGQIRGALRMLGLDDADRLLLLCEEQIAGYASGQAEVVDEKLELLAESLCGLGLYIQAVAEQRPDCTALLAPLLSHRLYAAPTPVLAASEADAAELIADLDRALQAGAAGAELERGGQAPSAAVRGSAANAAPAAEIPVETQRLPAVEASARDAGLLELYLAEAGATLDAIAHRHAALTADPGDREALRTVRCGFHTLQESSRTVGLAEFSAIASEIEAIHSRLIEQELPVTGAVLTMIDVAQGLLRDWVGALSRNAAVVPELGALQAALFHVEVELPSEAPTGEGAPAISQIRLGPAPPDKRPAEALAAGAEPVAEPPVSASPVALAPTVEAERAAAARKTAAATKVPAQMTGSAVLPSERARADAQGHTVDPSSNAGTEAGLTRAPGDGKVPLLKADLLELANTVAWLRGQVREIEIQAQAQMRLRASEPQERRGGYDLHEIDHLAYVQDLTHSLSEALNGVATVQQSLLGNLQDAESILQAQREPLLES